MQTAMDVTALRATVHVTDPYTVRQLAGREQVLLGLSTDDQAHYLDDTHVLVATGGAGGTTTVLRSIAAQARRLGARVDILDLDRRRPSHPWAHNLEGIRVHDRPDQAHALLHELRRGLLHAADEFDGTWAARRLLVIEHTDRLLDALRQHYLLAQPDTQAEEAPAVEALAELLQVGRARGLQIIAGSAHSSPPPKGQQIRDAFPTRLVAYAGTGLWGRVAPEVWPVPPYSVIAGRMHLVRDGAATRLQTLYLSESQARAWARGTVPKEYR
ncbi:cell division protein FtsK [Streptomyces venezuelae]|uniref:cell division protein FtsK n=1 Tax=Streptomyces venezuelae TaxID=54571 RepID=UPI00343985EA